MARDVVLGRAGRLETTIAASVDHASRRDAPFLNWRLRDVLPESVASNLAALPFAPAPHTGPSGRRELHNDHRRYLAGDVLSRHPVARELAEGFQSWPVVRALRALTGATLLGTHLRVEYALDLDGFWLEPHTDLGVKALTFFIQFGEPGQEALGTDLYRDPGAWSERIPFGWNTGLVFVPSNCTWHGFEPRPIPGVRRSLIVNYVTEDWRERGQLAFPDRPVGPEANS